jgi:carbonic anhydrase
MSNVVNEVIRANAQYVEEFGEKVNLPMPPKRRIAILTCMDARLDPAKYAGLLEGDAHIIRNAGGRASDDAIRSLIISHKLLGTRDWFVIHHTDCGMETFNNEIISELLEDNLETATVDENGWSNTQKGGGNSEGKFINWLTINNQEASVIEDVKRIRNHPLVSDTISIYGYIFNVKNGEIREVKEGTEIGRGVVVTE